MAFTAAATPVPALLAIQAAELKVNSIATSPHSEVSIILLPPLPLKIPRKSLTTYLAVFDVAPSNCPPPPATFW